MDPQRAAVAARLGADMIGLVFAPSRRRVSLGQALEIAEAVRGCGASARDRGSDAKPRPPTPGGQGRPSLQRNGEGGPPSCASVVGVFVNFPPEEVNAAAEACGLDYIQLSGDESPDYCRNISRPFIKALRLAPDSEPGEMALQMDAYIMPRPDALFPLDPHVPGEYGGSGRPWDWERCALLARRYSIIVAGGLSPENVAETVKAVAPWGVDVSSGVETGGVKDEAKIRSFIEAVRSVSTDRASLP